jgi:hypothetical protein
MNRNVLLLLTQSLSAIKKNLNAIIEQSLSHTSGSLFVCINPMSDCLVDTVVIEDRLLLRAIVNKFYESSLRIKPGVNVNCLLNNVITNPNPYAKYNRVKYCDLILTDERYAPNVAEFCLTNVLAQSVGLASLPVVRLEAANEADQADQKPEPHPNDRVESNSFYKNGIVAGTFDRLHIGHKILLTESALLVQNRLLVGITHDKMLLKKTLNELIEPLDARIGHVTDFLGLVAPHLDVLCVPINDPFGPSVVEEDYQVRSSWVGFMS